MKQAEYKSLGLTVRLAVPESVEEFDTNAKRVGACLAEATNNVVYRGSLAEFRSVLLHGRDAEPDKGIPGIEGLDTIHGVDRRTKPVLDKTGNPRVANGEPVLVYDETEQEFLDRLMAEKRLTVEAIQPHADVVAASMVFDASQRERKAPTPKKLGENYIIAAEQLLANPKFSPDRFNKALLKYLPAEQCNYAATDDVEKDIQAIGWLLRAKDKAEQAAKDAARASGDLAAI